MVDKPLMPMRLWIKPAFVKAGSIVPMDKISLHTGESNADSLEIRIYKGADGNFNLYEDEGDSYNYEDGKFSVIPSNTMNKIKPLSLVTGKVNTRDI